MALQDLISDFTAIIEKVFSLQEKKQVALVNILRDHYNNYKIMLQKVSPEDHADFFLSPFKKNKIPILADKSDSWIRDNPVHIQWNEGAKNCNPKYRINLSGIYNTSLRLAKDAKEAFSQLVGKEKLSIEQMYPEVRFPDLLLYHYYKLVHYYLKQSLDGPKGSQATPEQKDLDSLSSVISKFEQHLGFKKENSTSNDKPNTSQNSGTGTSGPMQPVAEALSSFPIGEIFSGATKVMQQSGIKLPENVKLPSTEEFSGMLQGLFNNPQVQNLFNGLMKSMEGARTPQEALSKVTSGISGQDMTGLINSMSGAVTESSVSESQSEAQSDVKFDNSSSEKTESKTETEDSENISLVQFD